MKQILKIRNIILNTVLNLIQMQNLDLSDYLFIDYPNLKNFRLFILQYTRKKITKKYFGNFSFHWLEIEQIEKILIKISKFELSIEKIYINRTRNLIYLTLVSIVYVS